MTRFAMLLALAAATDPAFAQAAPAAPKPALFDFGEVGAQIITYLILAFGAAIASLFAAALAKLLKWLGVKNSEALKDQLQTVILNGINAGAAKYSEQLRANPASKIEIKNKVTEDALRYAQQHGAEIIKALGLDPHSGAAVDAIKARIETALVDPAQPTAAVVTPDEGKPPIAGVIAPSKA